MDIIEEHTSLISGLVGEIFNPAHHNDQTPAEVHTDVEELVENLRVQHVHAAPRVLQAVKTLATARFLHVLRTAGVVATQPTQPTESQNGQDWQFLPMILALLVGAILAKLFLRSQPLQLLQVSIYNFAEWLWRFVYYFLVCITGPTETDGSLWNPGWRPTVTADNWRDEYKAVPDPYPNIPRAIPSGSFHKVRPKDAKCGSPKGRTRRRCSAVINKNGPSSGHLQVSAPG